MASLERPVSVSISIVFAWLRRAPGLPILRVRGIVVELHATVVIPIILYAGVLASTRFLGRYPDQPDAAITVMTVVAVLLLPVSVLLHELGHAFQARRERIRADKITLWGLGGVAWIGAVRSPGAAFRMTAAGPLVSLSLALVLGALSWLGARAGLPDGVIGVTVIIAEVNAVMFAYNLMPVYPMDGGRILHSALWRLRGLELAMVWAPRVALVVASAVIALGALGPFFLSGLGPRAGFLPGVSIMIQGMIMMWMALSSQSAARLSPGGRWEAVVGDVLEAPESRYPPAPGLTIAQFLRDGAGSGWGTAAFPVLEDGRAVGVISSGIATQVPVAQRERTVVADVMLHKEDAVVLGWDTPLAEAFQTLQSASSRGVVLDGGRVSAIVQISDLADALLRVKDAERGVPTA